MSYYEAGGSGWNEGYEREANGNGYAVVPSPKHEAIPQPHRLVEKIHQRTRDPCLVATTVSRQADPPENAGMQILVPSRIRSKALWRLASGTSSHGRPSHFCRPTYA